MPNFGLFQAKPSRHIEMDTSQQNQCSVRFMHPKAGEYKVVALNDVGQAVSAGTIITKGTGNATIEFVRACGCLC